MIFVCGTIQLTDRLRRKMTSKYYLFLMVASLAVAAILAQEQCIVKEKRTRDFKPCQIPFRFRGQTYNTCTNITHPDGRFWCSTKVEGPNNEHVKNSGYFGFCDSDVCQRLTFDANVEKELEDYLNPLMETKRGQKSNFDRITDNSCDCKSFTECEWSKTIFSIFSRLSNASPGRQKIIDTLRKGVCSSGGIRLAVRCCDLSLPPIIETNTVLVQSDTDTNPELGTWKPGEEDCSGEISVFNIVGGKAAAPGEFPNIALLGYNNSFTGDIEYKCGGSLINKWYILTAAHCINSNLQTVVLGELVVSEDPDCHEDSISLNQGRVCSPKRQVHTIAKTIVHNGYDEDDVTSPNDIALIRLTKPAKLFEGDSKESIVGTICLPWNANDPGNSDMIPGNSVTAAGWGRLTNNIAESINTREKFGASSNILLKVKLPVLSEEDCNEYKDLRKLNLNFDLQLCAGGTAGEDTCSGDSGGPIQYQKYPGHPRFQIGLVSFGYSVCGAGLPAVYTKIKPYLPWISDHLEP